MKTYLKIISAVLTLTMLLLATASCQNGGTGETKPEAAPISVTDEYIITRPDSNSVSEIAKKLKNDIKELTGLSLSVKEDWVRDPSLIPEKEILLGKCDREESKKVYENLSDDEWKVLVSGSKIILAGESAKALREAVSCFISQYVEGKSKIEISLDASHGGISTGRDTMIVSSIPQLRDPCILLEDGVYYAYGTGWVCYKNTSGDLEGDWKNIGKVCTTPKDAIDCYWAPEVYKYNGAFYMFTTYKSEKTGHRGCTVMRADKPEGPFVEISDGHVTPSDWDAIDGTLYIDEENTPWMVFVHEWTSTDDGIGRMAAAKMSDDLTHFISEPIELFRADDPSWSRSGVTDGCWMYRCKSGELLMIWSTSDEHGYCVGIARSDNGKVDGNWSHDDKLLYSKSMTGEYDGGHGIIFKDISGELYLSIHSPNNASAGRKETPVFIAIREENGTLVWDK